MKYYVCIDDGEPFQVEINSGRIISGSRLVIKRYGYAQLLEVIDVHNVYGGTQLQTTVIEAPILRDVEVALC